MAREMDLKYGVEGEYYVGSSTEEGKVLDRSRPPRTQPSLLCDWQLSEDGAKLQWSGMEKFYGYTEWLRNFITRVFPEGTVLDGEVQFEGEIEEDKGVIQIVDNRIRVIPHGGEQPRRANIDSEYICCEFQSAIPNIVQSLGHYRDHHDGTLGLPLKVDDYMTYIRDVAAEHKCTLPEREWITGKDGDVTQAVYFSVLLNPNLSDHDVRNILNAYNNLFDAENNPRLPKPSLVRKYWEGERYIESANRSFWTQHNYWTRLKGGYLVASDSEK